MMPVGARPLTRRRFDPGSWDTTGRYVNGPSTDTAFYGSFQPISRRNQREVGGERTAATHTVYTVPGLDLRPSQQDGGWLADRIIVASGPLAGVYEVESAQPYDEFAPLPHYEADLTRYNEPDPAYTAPSTAETALQCLRSVCKAANNLTNAQIVVQLDKQPRPPLPYLAALVDASDAQVQATDSAQQVPASLVTVTGGAEGDLYTVDAAGQSLTYTRTADDTDATVAAAIAALANATGVLESAASGASFFLVALVGTLDTEVSGPLSLDPTPAPATVQVGLRTGSLNLHGYGNAARPWMERARSYLASPAGLALQSASGVTIQLAGEIVTEQVDLGTGYEQRCTCSFTLSYQLRLVAQSGIEAEHVIVAGFVNPSGTDGLPFLSETPWPT